MKVELKETQDAYSISFSETLTSRDSFDVKKFVDSLDKSKVAIIDISEIQEMDSLGMGYLLAFHSEFKKPITIICENERLFEKLDRVLLPKIIEIKTAR